MSNWENSDLVRRLCYALDMAQKTVKYLGAEGFSHPDDPNYNVQAEKIIGETASLLLIASASEAYIEVDNRVKELANILIPYARNGKTLHNICLYPTLALDYAHPHICLTKIGYPDQNFDAILTKAVNSYSHCGHERIPYRMIEQEWMKKMWNNTHKSIDKILPYTLLANPIDLLLGTRDDMYAFTHAMMYASDFNSIPWGSPRPKEELLEEADAMLAKCLDAQDYDLTAELLLSWPLTGACWSAAAIFAFQVLTNVENEIGFLPSPSIQAEAPKGLAGENRKKYLYGTTYHTIYVMGLLCGVILQQQKNPPRQIPKNDAAAGSAKKIMGLLDKENRTPYWMSVYTKLNEDEQDAISSFLFNILLIRTISKMEYANVYQLLKVGQDLGLTDTAMARQTAELLDRVSLLSVSLLQ